LVPVDADGVALDRGLNGLALLTGVWIFFDVSLSIPLLIAVS
jgi:hypothetical protein